MAEGRKKLQALAKERLLDAKALLGRKRWSGAYYLSGYAVELALKSRILVYMVDSDYVFGSAPQKIQLRDFWIHDLYKLVGLGGLEEELMRELEADAIFNKYWSLVNEWNESARYVETSESEAKELYRAIDDRENGVFKWIRKHW